MTIPNDIRYRPSIAGRVARLVLPVLHAILPESLFRRFYEFLYRHYKKTLRVLYYSHVLYARVFGNEQELAKARLTFRLLPYTMGGYRALENAFEITTLAESKNLIGAIVECGVAEGGTSAMMALVSKQLGAVSRTKWLFDSFEGLPDPTEKDYRNGQVGEVIRPIGRGECLGTIEQVQELMFKKLALPQGEVQLVKGWFQDTVPTHREKVGPIAILRLDGDWYESTKIPLENFYGQVVPGGYVIIDDYATCFGARKATDEFRLENDIPSPLIPDGRGGAWFEKPNATSTRCVQRR